MDQLQDFLRQRRETHESVENLGAFAQELHRRFVAAEREALGQERRLCVFVSIALGCLLEYPPRE